MFLTDDFAVPNFIAVGCFILCGKLTRFHFHPASSDHFARSTVPYNILSFYKKRNWGHSMVWYNIERATFCRGLCGWPAGQLPAVGRSIRMCDQIACYVREVE